MYIQSNFYFVFLQVAAYYMGVKEEEMEIRIFIIALLIPLIFMVWIRNLKYLAPVSMLANFLMAVGLGITFYYLVGTGELNFDKVKLFTPPSQWPEFFSLTIFAMEAIGVVMPLENAMRTPKALLGFCGVLNRGMSGVTLVYILLGFLGYLRYGDEVGDAITLNLDQTLMSVLSPNEDNKQNLVSHCCVYGFYVLKNLSLFQSCSNRQNLHRCRCVLHFWSSVLRMHRNHVAQHQRQVYEASRPRGLHHEDYYGNRVRAAGRGCSYYSTFHGSHRRLLLLPSRPYGARYHRDRHILGHRFWTRTISFVEKSPCFHFRDVCSYFWYQRRGKRYNKGLQ